MARRGVVGWATGCGKARAAIALALAGGEANLICVESHLLAELLTELRALGLDRSLWQVIRRPEHCASLRRINIATYSRLKRPIVPGAGRRTFARLLRRRLSTVIADEAHLLRNPQSEQSRAVWMLSPKRRYAMTATPVANYVRDLLPLTWWAMGDGTAAQPFGRYRPYFEEALLSSCDVARVGTEVFKESHCVFEWVTHEFVHSGLRTGAKREVPKPRNLDQLRRWIAPIIKRRVAEEPDVAKHFAMPSYEVVRHTVPWDDAHLAYYVRVADDFKAWFESAKKDAGADGRAISFVTVLARIGAVTRACTYPQHPTKHGRAYCGGLTSKQRALLKRLEELTAQGRRTICYVESPGMVNLFVRELGLRGIEAVAFHGEMPITQRTKELDQRFRFGSAPVLVATLGVTQTGLNLWQASAALFACGSWTPKTLRQAQGRLLRPQQTQHVVFEYFELEGSIDVYQAMGLAQKTDTMDAALDLLTPALADEPFLHVDAILDAFVSNLAELRGLKSYDFREELKRAS